METDENATDDRYRDEYREMLDVYMYIIILMNRGSLAQREQKIQIDSNALYRFLIDRQN